MDFRDFLDVLRDDGELHEVDELIDWDLQASAVCAMSQRVGGPAIRFNNIKDYPGMPLVGSVYSGPGFIEWPQQTRRMQGRIAMGIGLESETPYDELLETIIDRKKSGIRPIEVEEGPCQEVVLEGDDIDLYQYPIPRLHDKDGGRYLTSQVVLTLDDQKKWTNAAIYRLMLKGRKELVQGTAPRLIQPRHLDQMVTEAGKKGEPVPFAIIIGAPPELTMAACLNQPPGADEYSLAGGLGLNSITLVKAKLSDILVPAGAEMVLEGHIYPEKSADEGPFASISYYTDKVQGAVYQVECITQRKDPIFPFVAEGAKPSDSMCLLSVMHSVELTEYLRMCGAPVKYVTLPVEAKLCLAVVCLSAQPIPGLPDKAGQLIIGMSPFARQVIVVDPDVDSENFQLAFSDRNFKSRRELGYHVSHMEKPLGLTENHDFRSGLTSTLIIDATWRMDRDPETLPRRVAFETCFPDEVQEKVIKDWNETLNLKPKVWRYKGGCLS